MKSTTELFLQLKSAAQEEIMCREASDTSDAWQDLASPENVLAIIEIALPVLEQQSGWISCSERMPENPGFYICTMNGEVFEMYYYQGDCDSDKDGWLYFDMCGENRIELSHVTHWMNKPSPAQPSTPPQIDNDGWVEWGGGQMPVTGSQKIEVRLRGKNGFRFYGSPAEDYEWAHTGSGYDIVAYRVIKNDGREG